MLRCLRLAALLLVLACPGWAATVTHEIATADTGTTPNTSGSFTPATDDLLIACATATATEQATATLTNSAGTTFTQILRATATGHSVYCFVANSLVTSATSQTVTFNTSADPASGTVIFVEAVAGMTRTGLNAILQSAKQDSQSASTTPAPSFAASASTNNPTIGVVQNLSNPAGLTPPTSWTEHADTGHATPTAGGEIVSRDSGFTGTTITWGSTSATGFGDIILELDTSAAATCSQSIALLGVGCR